MSAAAGTILYAEPSYLRPSYAPAECLPRWATPRVPARQTLGGAMARIAAELGTPFMPWQRQVADTALELDPVTGRLVYREVRLTVPRQSGKTTLLLALILTRALGASNQDIRYTAQTGADARSKWMDDWLPVLAASRFSKLYQPRLTNGHEALAFRNGSLQGLLATTKKSGHGGTIDLGILDEAFAHVDARLEQALKPAMITRPQPQLWIVSTAGTPTDSPYLYAKVRSGRKLVEKGTTSGVCYFEWSADDDQDPGNPATWWGCMPALGYTVTEQAVAADYQSMLDDPEKGLSEFERAYLNRWVTAMGDPVVPLDKWKLLARHSGKPEWDVLALDVAPKDKAAAIVACGEVEGGLQTVVLDSGEGTEWLIGALKRRVEEREASPAGRPYVLVDERQCQHLLPEIEAVAGADRVITRKATEMGTACSFWLRVVREARVFHRGEPELVIALAGAGQAPRGDGWMWTRAKSGADITPLVAQTLAVSFWIGPWSDEDEPEDEPEPATEEPAPEGRWGPGDRR